MKTTSSVSVATILLACVVALSAAGCSDNSNPSGNKNNTTSPALSVISPAAGATNVSRTATISMRFTTPMDTNSVTGAFHLSGGSGMTQWMDSLSHHMGMGGMGVMNIDHMMQWMDSIQFAGQWHWNASNDSCWFVTDSMLLPDCDHMLYIYGGMRSHDGLMMDIDTMQYGGPMYHFHTQP